MTKDSLSVDTHIQTSSRRAPKLIAALAAIFVALVAGLGLAASPVAAHDSLTSSNPKSGANLEVAPTEIELTFSSEPMADSPAIAVTDGDGENVNVGEPVINGKVVTAPWTAKGDGSFNVNWRVVSSDGHPIDGELSFSIATDAKASASPAAADASAVSDETSGLAPNSPSYLWLAVLIALIIASLIAFLTLRKKKPKEDADADVDESGK